MTSFETPRGHSRSTSTRRSPRRRPASSYTRTISTLPFTMSGSPTSEPQRRSRFVVHHRRTPWWVPYDTYINPCGAAHGGFDRGPRHLREGLGSGTARCGEGHLDDDGAFLVAHVVDKSERHHVETQLGVVHTAERVPRRVADVAGGHLHPGRPDRQLSDR